MTCEEVLKAHFNKYQDDWHKKVHLYAVAEDWSPETVGRCLRDMAEEKDGKKPFLRVGYYDGKYAKGLAKYIRADKQKITYYKLPDGTIIKKHER